MGTHAGGTRRWRLRQWRGHVAALVAPLVLALIGAPAVSALRNECPLCPRTCPMHQHHDVAASPEHAHCHVAAAQTPPHPHGAAADRGVALSRTACGNNGGVPGTVLPPVLLPAAQGLLRPVIAGAAPERPAAPRAHAADPPDTPPPIHAA